MRETDKQSSATFAAPSAAKTTPNFIPNKANELGIFKTRYLFQVLKLFAQTSYKTVPHNESLRFEPRFSFKKKNLIIGRKNSEFTPNELLLTSGVTEVFKLFV